MSAEAIDEVVIIIQSEVRRNKVVFRTELAIDLPSIMGDRIQLQQVIMNLVLDFIQAMSSVEDRKREFVIRTRRGTEDDILVAVRDSGSGVDALNGERIFDAFYTTKPADFGMVLTISRSIVEWHGGRLWATLDEGPGATFQFTLSTCH
jgi:signal transduction histidine kinase